LLLLDGYGSHCTKEFLDFCDDHYIIPFCLPPHTTHLLQPLDVVCFQPYKYFHAEAVDAATRTGCSDFDKLEFLTALTSIRQQIFKLTTVLSAFHQTGLIPFNPDIVLSKLRPATPSPPSTPPRTTGSTSTEIPTILLTIRSLKRQADQIWNSNTESPTFKQDFTHLLWEVLHKHRVEHRQLKIWNTLRLLKRLERLGIQEAGSLFKKACSVCFRG
ncbi:DDE-domain-containing protein, partial [Wilcoxina mikolae CBS 423.85]